MTRPLIAFCLFAAQLTWGGISIASEGQPAAYQRDRVVPVRQQSWNGHSWQGTYSYGGFYNPWFAPQAIAGVWYERPYPYHFDYYRMRYRQPELVPVVEPECPCTEAQVP